METTIQKNNLPAIRKRKSQFRLKCIRFAKNKLAMLGLVIIIFFMLAALTAPLYIGYDKVISQKIMERFQTPNSQHWFDTDQFGRDLFARVVYGARISLFAGILTIGIAFFFGLILGSAAGFFGGGVDSVIMRFCDILMAVPSLLLSMAIVTALGQGLFKMLIALSVAVIPQQARTVRAAVLTLRNQEYVEAARTYGSTTPRIIIKHIIPNIIGPLIVTITMSLGGTILRIANLGFLGIGIASPTPEWGTIISENQTNIRFYPYLGIIPGLFIMISVLSLSFIGDGLRDALDPKMKN